MSIKKSIVYFILITAGISLSTCTSEKGIPDYNNFPDDVGRIIFTKCATTGCHTDASKGASGGLSMESWDKLFQGGNGAACVIPYRHDYSTFFSYINTFSDLGVTLSPTMPYGENHLTREEVILLKNWINNGAPSRDGFVKFSDNPNRKKFYVTNQGCDVVTVFDEATLLPMRYINVGSTAGLENPHMVRVSPDGQFWYILNTGGLYLEKYRTSDDSFVSRAYIGPGNWNTFVITDNSQKAYCIDFATSNAKLAEVSLSTMTGTTYTTPFNSPHGSALNLANDTLYITQQQSSKVYKLALDGSFGYTEVNAYTGPDPSPALNIHEIRFSPDGSRYYLTCQGTSEVRIMQTTNDSLLAIIPVGASPSEMSFSTNPPYNCYVTCTEDLSIPGKRGSVAVINYLTYTATSIYAGHQPHGIEVDDAKKLVYVVNTNVSADGPAPHHTSECGGKNGNVTFMNMSTNTMVLTPTGNIKSVEVSVFPYSVAVRN